MNRKFDKKDRGDRDRDSDYGGGYDRYDRGGRGDEMDMMEDSKDGRKIIGGSHQRKKVCRFCTDSEFVLDYKNIRVIGMFVTEHGKIVPRRISGACAEHQRKLTTAIKRARTLALVGYTTSGFGY